MIELAIDFGVFIMLIVAIFFAIYGTLLWVVFISAWVDDVIERPKSREEENKKSNDIS